MKMTKKTESSLCPKRKCVLAKKIVKEKKSKKKSIIVKTIGKFISP